MLAWNVNGCAVLGNGVILLAFHRTEVSAYEDLERFTTRRNLQVDR